MMKILKNIFIWLMPHGLYSPLRVLFLKNKYKSLNKKKYKNYKPAGGYGDKMLPYINFVRDWTNIKVENVFEIGANFAQDADFLREIFNVKPENVYVFEAHPEIYKAITEIHPFNVFNNAVFNENKDIIFNIFPLDCENTGLSSIHNISYGGGGGNTIKVKVQAIRMDNFMKNYNIKEINFLKIDVEGATYEVLDGFGKRLKDVNCIQLEAEHGVDNFPTDWILYDKIENILKQNDFELVLFDRNNGMKQSDSFWVRKEYIKYT